MLMKALNIRNILFLYCGTQLGKLKTFLRALKVLRFEMLLQYVTHNARSRHSISLTA